jgi:hypothetical protein
LLSTWRPRRKSADILAHFLPLSEPSALYLFCDLSKELGERQITVYLFGAISSQSCCSCALKKTVEENEQEDNEEKDNEEEDNEEEDNEEKDSEEEDNEENDNEE